MLNVRRWGPSGNPSGLLVLCHGVGADAGQMQLFADAIAVPLPRLAILAPDGPDPFDAFPIGRQWFSLRDRTPAVLQAAAAPAVAPLEATIAVETARLGLDPARVAIGGFSQGAMMALLAGLRRTPPPACILAYSGALLDTPELAATLSGRPDVLLVHGEADDVVPFAHGPQAESVLRRLGIPVTSCWCPGVGHWVDPPGIAAGIALLRRHFGETSPDPA